MTLFFLTLHEFFHRTITSYKNTLNITIFRGPHENNIGAKLNWNYFTTFHTNNRLPIKTWFLLTLNEKSIYIYFLTKQLNHKSTWKIRRDKKIKYKNANTDEKPRIFEINVCPNQCKHMKYNLCKMKKKY